MSLVLPAGLVHGFMICPLHLHKPYSSLLCVKGAGPVSSVLTEGGANFPNQKNFKQKPIIRKLCMALQRIKVSTSLKNHRYRKTIKCPINGNTHFINEKWQRYDELTGLFLDVQSDFEAFVQEVHNTLEVCLFKLPRGQSRSTWGDKRCRRVQATTVWVSGMLQSRSPSVYLMCYVPSRRPPGVSALLSPGQVFLLAVMETSSKTLSARAPSIPCGLKSTSTRWLSVPPDQRERVQESR